MGMCLPFTWWVDGGWVRMGVGVDGPISVSDYPTHPPIQCSKGYNWVEPEVIRLEKLKEDGLPTMEAVISNYSNLRPGVDRAQVRYTFDAVVGDRDTRDSARGTFPSFSTDPYGTTLRIGVQMELEIASRIIGG